MQIVDHDRPRRLATSVRSPYMDLDGTLAFAPAGAGGTQMRWSWDMRLPGAMQVLSPGSRHLYAGHRLASDPGNRQAHPGTRSAPGSDATF